jgi:hypothetical protein
MALDSEAVTDEQKKLVDDIIYLRGRIVTSYCQAEFLLGRHRGQTRAEVSLPDISAP